MVTSIVALLLAAIGFLSYELIMFRRSMISNLSTLADIIGQNSTAALAFNDPVSAEEILGALKAESHIVRACIYGKDGNVFAAYYRFDASRDAFPPPQKDGHRFQRDSLVLFRGVYLDQESLGTISLESDLREIHSRFALYGAIVAVLTLAASMVALVVSSKLQRLISDPILGLAQTARIVATDKNYSVRAQKHGHDELGVLIEDFNEMLDQIQHRDMKLRRAHEELKNRATELEAANRELVAFSYSVSHDLRAPLRKVDGFCLALYEDYADKLDETGLDYLQRARAASQRMAELIDNMLQLSRVTRTEMTRETVNLSSLAKTILAELGQTEPTRNVGAVVEEDLIVNGDPSLLRVMLENLIGNAWKFTRNNSEAHIQFGSTQDGGKPIFFVRDDGAGFDMAYAERLFTPFQRLHSSMEFEGTGVGLATVQRIISRHGGRVWAEGTANQGATIYFTL